MSAEKHRQTPVRTFEQHQQIPFSPKLTDTKGRIITGVMDVIGPNFFRPAIENILVKTDTEYSPDFGDALIRSTQAGYEIPVLVSNHNGISDALFPRDPAVVIRKTVNEQLPTERQLKGWAIILAASLHYGQQGPWRTGFYNGVLDSFEEGDITPFLTVRPEDKERYGDELKGHYDPIQEGVDLIDAIRKRHGIIVNPEGSTVGEEMIEFKQGSIFRIIQAIEASGNKALVLPITKLGSKKIESRRKLPTLIGIASGINAYNRHITKNVFHAPMRFDEGELGELYRRGKKRAINELIGGIIASRLPEDERGPYGKYVRAA